MDAFVKRLPVGSAAQSTARKSPAAATPKSPKRPAKRLKREEVGNSNNDDDGSDDEAEDSLYHPSRAGSPVRQLESRGRLVADHDFSREDSPGLGADGDRPPRPTAIESSLPAIISDEEAIQQYESFKASQQSEVDADQKDSAASRLDSRKWVRGKSSLYVDAFNLALDTVLDEESQLFDCRESAVFQKWRALPYESQFLYVDSNR